MESTSRRSAAWATPQRTASRRRNDAALRTTVRVIWVAGCIPFLAVALSMLRQQPEPHRLQVAAAAHFTAPLGGLYTAVDRAGVHVALIDGDADVAILSMDDNQVVSHKLSMPWNVVQAGGTMLQFVDTNCDELVDLRLMPLLDEELLCKLESERPADYRTPSFEFRQQAGKFILQGRPEKEPEQLDQSVGNEITVNGRPFQLLTEDGWRQATHLRGPRGGRQSLKGVAQYVSDLNADGCDEVLTCEYIPEDLTIRIFHRVYSLVGRQFRTVWERETLLPENDLTFAGETVPLSAFADIDGDGLDELLCAEASTGQLLVLRWQDLATD